jgi:NADH:ubiquinone oxidoreductase subunit 3 (subunit A)
MLNQYFHILVFAAVGTLFGFFILFVASLVRDRGGKNQDFNPYECGMAAEGTPWIPTNIRFYVFALLFLIFDVEALFVFPWAVQFRTLGLAGFVEVMIFVGILLVGLVYAWRKGALKWE